MKSDKALPRHIAIIMDGNGRWAKRRMMPRGFGHQEGVKVIDRIADAVFSRGIGCLTLFAFSTENWKRPEEEVDGLLDLFKKYLRKKMPLLAEKGIRLNVLGDTSVLDAETLALISDAYEKTHGLRAGTLNICFNYGGRAEIVRAAAKLAGEGREITEQSFSDALYTAGMPDPDILIRTGGEHRISNFLLYQTAYSEIYFTGTLWPDFTEKELDEILADFAATDRRYGKVK